MGDESDVVAESEKARSGDEDTPVLEEPDGAVMVLRLHRPDRLNAVSPDLYRALLRKVEESSADPAVRAVVLTGTGRAFSAGADLQAHGSGPPDERRRREYVELAQQVNRRLQTLPKPVVGAVNGHAVGAGLELALSCDLLVVAREAKLRLPEVALGTFVGGGVTYTLPARVGRARARELLFLGRFFRGEETPAMGLANRAVPAEQVLDSALKMAHEISANGPVSLRLLKGTMDRAEFEPPETVLEAEKEALLHCMGTRDWQEGVEAFREGREPEFKGE